MNGLKGWRTIIVNLVMALPMLLEELDKIDIVPENIENFFPLILLVVNIALRSMTTTPIGKQA